MTNRLELHKSSIYLSTADVRQMQPTINADNLRVFSDFCNSSLMTNDQLPTINYQLPTINYQLPTANCQLSQVNCQLKSSNITQKYD